MIENGIPQKMASKLIDEIKVLPRKKIDDGMVTAKLYNGSSAWIAWIQKMPRPDFERIGRQLAAHNSPQPALFVIEEFNGGKENGTTAT